MGSANSRLARAPRVAWEYLFSSSGYKNARLALLLFFIGGGSHLVLKYFKQINALYVRILRFLTWFVECMLALLTTNPCTEVRTPFSRCGAPGIV